MKGLLLSARQEIIDLRRRNEILAAKMEMVDLFACVLFTKPAVREGGAGHPDVAWQLQEAIDAIDCPAPSKKKP